MSDVPGLEWTIKEEFAQRLGCGVSAAVVLPAWFLLLLFVVETTVALAVTGLLFVLAVVFAALALRRTRRLPRTVSIDGDGATIATESRAGPRRRPLAELRRIDIDTSLGVWPMRLGFHDGVVWRLPKELQDLDGFLATVRRLVPGVVIVDHNPPEPDLAQGAGR